MFSFFGKTNKPLKGYKITSVDRKQKYGIAADSLTMLQEKAAHKMKIENCKIYLAKDGTEIEDEGYFETIEPQTLFVVAADSITVKTDFQLMYDAIRNVQANVFTTADIIKNFVNENRTEFDKFIHDLQNTAQTSKDNTAASNRREHEEWFDGVPSTILTKEEVMARRSQDRIRGYFYKAKEELTKSEIYRTNRNGRQILIKILEIFQHFLTGVDYFSSLFNRKWPKRHQIVTMNDDDIDGTKGPPRKKLKETIRKIFDDSNIKKEFFISLCNERGEFRCQGQWNNDSCKYSNHQINPYASRENVILFQVWNLDHQIEINRTVIPSILAAVKNIVIDHAICSTHKQPAKTISVIKYFLELFTIDNLRLVHIVCHDKGSHNLKSKGKVICGKCKEYKALEKILNKIDGQLLI